MTVIRHRECSCCGTPWGAHPTVRTPDGMGWATHCPSGRAVDVEYVPVDQLAGAVSHIEALIDAGDDATSPHAEYEEHARWKAHVERARDFLGGQSG